MVYAHELCAIWTPEVYLDARNKFKDIKKAVKRCNKLKCSFCREKGAGLGCFVKGCQMTYHYLCAKESGSILVNKKFIAFCPDHRSEVPEEDQPLEMQDEDSIL